MKNIADRINPARESFISRVEPSPIPTREQTRSAGLLFNQLIQNLSVVFPACVEKFRRDGALDQLRQQWALAFLENGITSMDQLEAGMRVARRQASPFLPSPGKFIQWCREESGVKGITCKDVLREFWDWRKRVFEFDSSELYPWSQPLMYHICTALRRRCVERQLSTPELEQNAVALLDEWGKRIASGKPIPPIRRAIEAPKADRGPTPAQLLKEKARRIEEKKRAWVESSGKLIPK